MDRKQELQYLIGLVTEASKFDGTSDQDNVRLEVESRIARLIEGFPGETPRQKKADNHRDKVHMVVNGKQTWVKRELVTQVPYKLSPTGYKWVFKSEVDGNGEKN